MSNRIAPLMALGCLASMSSAYATDEAPAAPADGGLQEVVVTAQRRSESVQKSSLEIQVLDSSTLANAGVTRAEDLQSVVPGLTTASSGLNFSTYIRGVGSFDTDANSDSSIAYNINGVFISRPNGVGDIFFDLDRVEVLEGPQGTLYGRNASGGAINLITKRPTFEESGEVSVESGNYGLVQTFAAVGGPVTDTLALRAAFQETKHDGYLTDGYDDQDSQAARLSALWQPNADLSTLVVGEFVHEGGMGSAAVFRSSLRPEPLDPWTGPSLSPPPESALLGGTPILNNGYVDSTLEAISAETNWNLGPATLTFIPAFRYSKPDTLTYQPGFYFDTAETSSQQSYELRLSNATDVLKWVTGVYFFDENQTQDYTLQAIPIQYNRIETTLSTRSYAAFGETTYSVTHDLRLIGGLRYTEDKKGQDGFDYSFVPVAVFNNDYGRRTDANVSFKTGTEYDLTEQNMLFATISTGYKAGGFFPGVAAPDNTYKPEKLTAFTLGSRNRFDDNRIQVNAEGFYWDYKDKQERFLGATPSGSTGLLTTNAGKATIFGANVDLTAKTGNNGTLHGSVEYTHSKYDQFTYTVVNSGPFGYLGYSADATTCALGPVGPVTAIGTQQTVNCSGKPLPHAPAWTGSLGYDYAFRFGNGDDLSPGVKMQASSGMYLSPDFITSGYNGGYAWFDTDLAYHHKAFTATAWVHNIGNTAVYTGGFRYPFSLSEKAPFPLEGDPSTFYADIRPPRTFGLTLKADF
jgi:iron complex outermembrane recepter protein